MSRRDAFRPCSRDSSGDKVSYALLAKKKTFLIGIGPPYRLQAISIFLCNMATHLDLYISCATCHLDLYMLVNQLNATDQRLEVGI